MLVSDNYKAVLTNLLERIECGVEIPEQWAERYFTEEGIEPTSYDERRRFVRFRLRTKAIMKVEGSYPAFPRTDDYYAVYTCDIGRGGLGFLHTEQLLPGELCELWLTTRQMKVEVTRCRYHNEKCYQIGVKPL